MCLMDYADFLRVGEMKNKLKMIYCVSKSFNDSHFTHCNICTSADPHVHIIPLSLVRVSFLIRQRLVLFTGWSSK